MRIPVFARGSNPAIDRRIQRKSESYGLAEVAAGRADWVDPSDHSKGIICRAFLYSGGRQSHAVTVDVDSICPGSTPPDAGLKFVRPNTWKNPSLPRIHVHGLLVSAPTWDWSGDPIFA
jgi:hypothetical protein